MTAPAERKQHLANLYACAGCGTVRAFDRTRQPLAGRLEIELGCTQCQDRTIHVALAYDKTRHEFLLVFER